MHLTTRFALAVLTSGLVLMNSCSPKKEAGQKAGIDKAPFGTLSDGQAVDLYTLHNAAGMTAKISTYGGTIVSLMAPDKAGTFEEVTLGMDSLAAYEKGVPYFGALIGRYGNRIAKGKFELDGKTYNLPINNSPNSLHGGTRGFDKRVWTATPVDGDEPALKLTYASKDGEEGYPGTLNVEVTYTLQKDNALKIDYKATTDKPTVVNLTNHTYFNLTGNVKRDILDHVVTIYADKFVPVGKDLIPTGKLEAVTGTPFDFTKPRVVGKSINDSTDVQIKNGGGYDHAWVLTDSSKTMKKVATVLEPTSGRVMEVQSTEPAVQFYTGNFLDGTLEGRGVTFKKRFAICLETEHYPDSPNQPSFPTTVLRPGQTYQTTTVYTFSAK